MQRIFVCDDNQPVRDEIAAIIKNYIMMENLSMILSYVCSSPDELIRALENHFHNGDLYFLDIDFKHEITGFSLAKQIREKDSDAKIVFVTTHAELAMLTFQYKIEAMDYIIKDDRDNLKNKIISCIQTAHKRYFHQPKDKENYYTIQINDRAERIRYEDILFITATSTPHKLILHTANRQIFFYGEIKNLVNRKKGLVRCHRSYVVNVNNIKVLNRLTRTIQMNNGEICPVSIRFLKEVSSLL